jgi:hypothetical protein
MYIPTFELEIKTNQQQNCIKHQGWRKLKSKIKIGKCQNLHGK